MYSKTKTGKTSKGMPSIASDRGRLKIRLNLNGVRSGFFLGLSDIPENRIKGEEICRQIHLDLLSENFDPTFRKYKPNQKLTLIQPIVPKTQPDLATLWNQYSNYKKRFISPSTYTKDYQRVARSIAKLPSQQLSDPVAIRDALLDQHTADSARRLLKYLKSCCNWAVSDKLIESNPFASMTINVTRSQTDDSDVNPFSKEERDLIIKTFASDPYYSYYTNYVRFLFYVGCRPSEAIGLQWKHIKDGLIEFNQAVVVSEAGLVLKPYLKTQKKRNFPITSEVQAILFDLRSPDTKSDDFLFPSPDGKFIDQHNFCNRAWKSILQKCGVEYRKPYQTRHTFITQCVEAHINSTAIGRWTGTSANMIDKHYGATNFTNLRPPNLT